MGNRNKGTQQVKYVGNSDAFCFGFNFMSPKWTRTKLLCQRTEVATNRNHTTAKKKQHSRLWTATDSSPTLCVDANTAPLVASLPQ